MVSRIICILLFSPLLCFGQNLEFIDAVLISEPGQYVVPEGELWKLKSVTGVPTSIAKQYCALSNSSGGNGNYNYYFNIQSHIFSINNVNYGKVESEVLYNTSVYGQSSCNYISDNFDLDNYWISYNFNSEIYLSVSDTIELYIQGIHANILKFNTD